MTAKVMAESVETYKAAGMNGVVPKPIILDQLERALADARAVALPEKLARMRSDIGVERCEVGNQRFIWFGEECLELLHIPKGGGQFANATTGGRGPVPGCGRVGIRWTRRSR